ncbi:DUF6228 family protein [Streptomyces sp. NPDC001315]
MSELAQEFRGWSGAWTWCSPEHSPRLSAGHARSHVRLA